MELIKSAFKLLGKIFKSTVGKVILGIAGAVGTGAAAHGTVKAVKAHKKNKLATAIRDKYLEKYENSLQKTNEVLASLGKKEEEVINGFAEFSDVYERIHSRPEFKEIKKDGIDLPNVSLDELKVLPNQWELVAQGTVGGMGGAAVGLALCGFNIFALGPAAFLGGILILKGGKQREEKAAENLRQANKLKSDVNCIVVYHEKIQACSQKLEKSLDSVRSVYNKEFEKMKRLTEKKQDWNEFSSREKRIVQNTVKLVQLLYFICGTKLIVKDGEDESVNDIKVDSTVNKVKQDLKRIK